MILAATLKETGSVFWRQFRQAKYICFYVKEGLSHIFGTALAFLWSYRKAKNLHPFVFNCYCILAHVGNNLAAVFKH